MNTKTTQLKGSPEAPRHFYGEFCECEECTGEPESPQHSPLPWKLVIGQDVCFHKGNRVSIVQEYQDGDEPCVQTVAEVWSAENDIDIRDGELIIRACNAYPHAERLAEVMRDVATKLIQGDQHGARMAAVDALAEWEKQTNEHKNSRT